MEIIATKLNGVCILKPNKWGDERGFFSEVWSEKALAELGIKEHFVQDNHVFSAQKSVLRGMHFQRGDAAQGKLVRVVAGSILDVILDINPNSPTYGEYLAIEVSAQQWNQIWVPAGYAHGYITLQENCQVLYKVTNDYNAKAEGGVNPFDPNLGIDWQFPKDQIIINSRDASWPNLSDLKLSI